MLLQDTEFRILILLQVLYANEDTVCYDNWLLQDSYFYVLHCNDTFLERFTEGSSYH